MVVFVPSCRAAAARCAVLNALMALHAGERRTPCSRRRAPYACSERALSVGQVKARGPPGPEDVSIAAHLLRLCDPKTGLPLPDELLAGEFGLFFAAGIESAGNAISWTM